VVQFPPLDAEYSAACDRYLRSHGGRLLDQAWAQYRRSGRGLVCAIFRPPTLGHPVELEYLDADHPDVVGPGGLIERLGAGVAERLEAYDPEREMVLVVVFDEPTGDWSGFVSRFRGVRPDEIPLDDRELIEREMEERGALLRPRGGFLTRD
jgi:hypothetical protein